MQLAHYYNEYSPMNDWHRDGSWVGLIFTLFFLVLIVAAAYYIVRAVASNRPTSTSYRDPLEIAKERYAKGDITKDELAEIKKELK